MNTPEPCDTCKFCCWNVMTEDEDNPEDAWCAFNLTMGIKQCPKWKHYESPE